jgi:ribonucleotide reductase alpha subunit
VIAVRCDEMSAFARTIMEGKNYAHYLSQQKRHETWPEVAERVSRCVVEPYLGADFTRRIRQLIAEKKFMPGGRYLYASGRAYPQVNSCFLFRAHDSREGWADIWYKCGHSLMTGGGVGVVYSDLREEGALVHGLGGRSTGPIALAKTVNEQGRYIRQGGSRRSAIWAGLLWKHKDIFKFISVKDWDEYTREGKRRDFNFPAPMDTTNISVILDDEFFEAYYDDTHPLHFLAADVYWAAIRHMLMTGEPGFSVDIGANAGENLRNACLAGDTLIAVADGRGAVPIKNLVGTSTPVYASDTAGNIKVGTLRNVRITRRNAELMRITMSDGGSFRVTPDHKVMLANGTFVEAISLRLGTSLASYHSDKTTVGEQVVTELGGGSWEDVYDGTVDDLHCFAVVTREGQTGVILHNCTEVVSRDDQDMCNLGSLNLSRFDNLDDFTEAVELTTAFLLCGSIYSRLPIPSMDAVRTKNRRLGLGLMGCHEWMLKRGYRYGEVDELAHWMRSYTMSGAFANRWADKLGVSRPVATRSIAPTGTISIVAETTSGVEPIFATALKRRYLDGNTWRAQYIVDPTAKRLIEGGTDPSLIEDSLTLAEDVERRVSFQVWLQTKVDHGIASCLAAGESSILTDGGLFDVKELAGHALSRQFADLEGSYKSYNLDGRLVSLTQGYNNGKATVVQISCEGGHGLYCTPNHKIATLAEDYSLSWIAAEDVQPGSVLVGRMGLDLWHQDGCQLVLPRLVGSQFSYERWTGSKDVTLPGRLTRELARLLGYLCSDGSVGINGISLTQQRNNVCEDFQELVERVFGIQSSMSEDRRSLNLMQVVANSREVSEFCRWLGVKKHDDPEDRLEVPLCIRRASRGLVREFLRGVTLDGYVSSYNVSVATSVSRIYLRQIQQLLLNMGIDCCLLQSGEAGERLFPGRDQPYPVQDAWCLVACGAEAVKFINMVGFAEERKQGECITKFRRPSRRSVSGDVPDYGLRDRLRRELLPRLKSRKFYDAIHSITLAGRRGAWLSRERLHEATDLGFELPPHLVDRTYVYRPVKSVAVMAAPRPTFDLSVPDGNSYIANGFVVHNTLNLPPWGSSINNEGTVTRFGTTLLKYLPQLRGITAYPDGARDGQPLVKVPYHEAIGKEGVIFEDSSEANCPSGVCGI